MNVLYVVLMHTHEMHTLTNYTANTQVHTQIDRCTERQMYAYTYIQYTHTVTQMLQVPPVKPDSKLQV